MLISWFRALILYFLLVFSLRLMGKRQLGQLEPAEFVFTMLGANLISIPMQDTAIPMLSGVVPLLTVLALELILAGLSLKSVKFRRILCGKPVILIENGHILSENLRKTRINMDELTGQLREKDVLSIDSVQYAILETDGGLSVFPYPDTLPASAKDAGIPVPPRVLPVTVVSQGQILRENLPLAGLTEENIRKELEKKQLPLDQVQLLTAEGDGKLSLYRRED